MGYEINMRFGIVPQIFVDDYRKEKKFYPGVYLLEEGRIELGKAAQSFFWKAVCEESEHSDVVPTMFYRALNEKSYEVDKGGKRAEEPFKEELDEEHVMEDCYGGEMYLIDPYIILSAMIQSDRNQKYKSYDIAIAALIAFIKRFNPELDGRYKSRPLAVYFYGH